MQRSSGYSPKVSGRAVEICGDGKRVDHLAVVAAVLRQLRVAEIVDERVPPHRDRVVSVGACVEAMVHAILMGTHTLYRVGETLRPWDLDLLLGQPVEPEQLSDDKLGRSLDCLFKAGLSGINTAIMLSALERYSLDTRFAHFDTTSISVHGAYSDSSPGDSEDPDGVPFLARGHSKDHRPDLKQVLFGLTVTGDGAIPLIGRITDGNRSDSLENGFNLKRLAEVLPNPRDTILVADCKLFSGANLLLAREHSMSILTLLPRTVGIWKEAFDGAREKLLQQQAPVLRDLVRVTETGDQRSEEVLETWRGVSVPVTYRWEKKGCRKSDTLPDQFPLRALVVHSTDLEKAKTKTRSRLVLKESKALDRLAKRFSKEEYHCEKDARLAATKSVAPLGCFHDVVVNVVKCTVPAKRAKRGRPRKDDPTPTREFFQASISRARNSARHEEWLRRESSFILVTSRDVDRTDAELLEAYKQQSGVEQAFRWVKGPARVAPIFLHSASRIAALGLVYIIALMVHALVQREIRRILAEKSATIPGNRGRTKKPTAEVVYRLMEGISSLPIVLEDGTIGRWLMGVTTEKANLLHLLGCDLLESEGIFVDIRPPGPGERGYRRPPDAPLFGRPRSGRTRSGRTPVAAKPKETSRQWLERRTR